MFLCGNIFSFSLSLSCIVWTIFEFNIFCFCTVMYSQSRCIWNFTNYFLYSSKKSFFILHFSRQSSFFRWFWISFLLFSLLFLSPEISLLRINIDPHLTCYPYGPIFVNNRSISFYFVSDIHNKFMKAIIELYLWFVPTLFFILLLPYFMNVSIQSVIMLIIIWRIINIIDIYGTNIIQWFIYLFSIFLNTIMIVDRFLKMFF